MFIHWGIELTFLEWKAMIQFIRRYVGKEKFSLQIIFVIFSYFHRFLELGKHLLTNLALPNDNVFGTYDYDKFKFELKCCGVVVKDLIKIFFI